MKVIICISRRVQVSVYSDNIVDTMEVVVTPASTCISVNTEHVEVGVAVLGSTSTGSIMVTNHGLDLLQYEAQVEPSINTSEFLKLNILTCSGRLAVASVCWPMSLLRWLAGM